MGRFKVTEAVLVMSVFVQAKLLTGLDAAIKTIPAGANHVAQDILAQAIII